MAVDWTAIVLAALGSSALGAIVGGYITTVTRGRIEREEAWRTRLIGAVDDLNLSLVTALRDLGSYLPGWASGEPWRSRRALLPAALAELAVTEDHLVLVDHKLSRVELLLGVDSDTYQNALLSMHLCNHAIGVLRGRPRAMELAVAVDQARTEPQAATERVQRDRPERLRAFLLMAVEDQGVPSDVDVDDDRGVAQWARLGHRAAGAAAHDFMQAAHEVLRPRGRSRRPVTRSPMR